MGLPRGARFFAQDTAGQSLTNRTAEVVDWDSSPVVNEPAGAFSHNLGSANQAVNTAGNDVTINWPGIYMMSVHLGFNAPAGTSEFLGIWIYRFDGTSHTLERFIRGGEGSSAGDHHGGGTVLVRVTQADINAGSNRFSVLAYQAEVVGATGSLNGIRSYWDIVRLDSV